MSKSANSTYFKCCVCNISLPTVYIGKNPPFLPGMSYKEDVFIMEEQSNDNMPVAIGGYCTTCGNPCCLQPSCSVIGEDGKRYCSHHKH